MRQPHLALFLRIVFPFVHKSNKQHVFNFTTWYIGYVTQVNALFHIANMILFTIFFYNVFLTIKS